MCVKLAGVGLNVCECAGKAESNPAQRCRKGTVER